MTLDDSLKTSPLFFFSLQKGLILLFFAFVLSLPLSAATASADSCATRLSPLSPLRQVPETLDKRTLRRWVKYLKLLSPEFLKTGSTTDFVKRTSEVVNGVTAFAVFLANEKRNIVSLSDLDFRFVPRGLFAGRFKDSKKVVNGALRGNTQALDEHYDFFADLMRLMPEASFNWTFDQSRGLHDLATLAAVTRSQVVARYLISKFAEDPELHRSPLELLGYYSLLNLNPSGSIIKTFELLAAVPITNSLSLKLLKLRLKALKGKTDGSSEERLGGELSRLIIDLLSEFKGQLPNETLITWLAFTGQILEDLRFVNSDALFVLSNQLRLSTQFESAVSAVNESDSKTREFLSPVIRQIREASLSMRTLEPLGTLAFYRDKLPRFFTAEARFEIALLWSLSYAVEKGREHGKESLGLAIKTWKEIGYSSSVISYGLGALAQLFGMTEADTLKRDAMVLAVEQKVSNPSNPQPLLVQLGFDAGAVNVSAFPLYSRVELSRLDLRKQTAKTLNRPNPKSRDLGTVIADLSRKFQFKPSEALRSTEVSASAKRDILEALKNATPPDSKIVRENRTPVFEELFEELLELTKFFSMMTDHRFEATFCRPPSEPCSEGRYHTFQYFYDLVLTLESHGYFEAEKGIFVLTKMEVRKKDFTTAGSSNVKIIEPGALSGSRGLESGTYLFLITSDLRLILAPIARDMKDWNVSVASNFKVTHRDLLYVYYEELRRKGISFPSMYDIPIVCAGEFTLVNSLGFDNSSPYFKDEVLWMPWLNNGSGTYGIGSNQNDSNRLRRSAEILRAVFGLKEGKSWLIDRSQRRRPVRQEIAAVEAIRHLMFSLNFYDNEVGADRKSLPMIFADRYGIKLKQGETDVLGVAFAHSKGFFSRSYREISLKLFSFIDSVLSQVKGETVLSDDRGLLGVSQGIMKALSQRNGHVVSRSDREYKEWENVFEQIMEIGPYAILSYRDYVFLDALSSYFDPSLISHADESDGEPFNPNLLGVGGWTWELLFSGHPGDQ